MRRDPATEPHAEASVAEQLELPLHTQRVDLARLFASLGFGELRGRGAALRRAIE